MKIGHKPKTRVEFKTLKPGDVFTVDGSTLTYIKVENMANSDTQSNVNSISLSNGTGHWWSPLQSVIPWTDASVVFG